MVEILISVCPADHLDQNKPHILFVYVDFEEIQSIMRRMNFQLDEPLIKGKSQILNCQIDDYKFKISILNSSFNYTTVLRRILRNLSALFVLSKVITNNELTDQVSSILFSENFPKFIIKPESKKEFDDFQTIHTSEQLKDRILTILRTDN